MKIALFPLDIVLFPRALLPLHIFEERYKEMLSECLASGTPFGIVRAQGAGIAVVGSTAAIQRVLRRYPDGRLDVLCEGRGRFRIEQLDTSRSFLQAEVEAFEDEALDSTREERGTIVALHLELLSLSGVGREAYPFDLDREVSMQLAWELPASLDLKQQLLSSQSDHERSEMLRLFYAQVLPALRERAALQTADGSSSTVM
jgi:Lon protease-like protein